MLDAIRITKKNIEKALGVENMLDSLEKYAMYVIDLDWEGSLSILGAR